nr:MAG: DNA pilot protein [Microvirus sp.]
MDPISAGIAVGGSLVNGLMQGAQNRANRRAQERENQKARDYNTQMWEKNNAYNDPTQQMSRLKNAGINPHLAYSQGGVTNTSSSPASSNASSMPEGRAPQFDVNAMLNARLVGEQINNIKADTKKKEAEASNIGTDTQGKTLQNGITTKVLENWQNTYDADMSFKKSATSVNYSNIQVNDKKIQVSDMDIKRTTQEITNLVTTNSKLETEINALVVKMNLDAQQTKNLIATMGLIKAQIDNYNAQSSLARETAKNQSYIRSNISADTANKSQLYQSMKRSNYIGEKYDYSDRILNYDTNARALDQMIEKTLQIQKQNDLIDKNITAQDLQNSINIITAPAKVVDEYKNAFTPFKSTTQTFDGDGYLKSYQQTTRSR